MDSHEETMKTLKSIEVAGKEPSNDITLSSGVVVRAKKVPPMYLITVMTRNPSPKPPIVFIKDMGRNMENPDDPNYIERVRAWERENNTAILDALIVLGTSLVSVPKGTPRPEKDDWLNIIKTLDMPMQPENESWRYLTWMKLIAATEEKDLTLIQEAVGRLSGISEKDVKAAEDFPGSDG